ncbi:NAD-dependent epimerase/dehydratase family protein [Bacillus sp. ISL-35]|uniref:NAD-dependent epimerase/dehydratase family protein n=1 Tax=Bacillus sp. ISL-35 TaxID=2819122 RepID=UPI001BEA655F|nr:NAD-dependent epimerase/dehydratase family protein [Bacillus sp. ISL-35]MBT2678832.1 NAD-dependent epimerase/dehydratase family protein [Bacillus sp. ISL-35]MBT2703824.1 NAD-dependent epimerase/dehydratase family protein [Chryseobacterium sp. ISL-80]
MVEKVLVTGGCGFIGSHIVEQLALKGFEILVVDNLSTGKKSNISGMDVSLYECSILSPEFHEIVLESQPDYIIHHAAQVSVANSIERPILDEEINIKGSIKVIEAALKAKVKKIVYASSAAVYGEPKYFPIDTEHPVYPLSPYGVSKLTVEKYLEMYHHLHGLDYTVLRYSNVFSPRQDPNGEGGVISIFMEKIKNGEPLTIFGDGEQTRDFVYVRDVAHANLMALKNGSGKTFNVSTCKAISLNELSNTMIQMADDPGKIIFQNERDGDIKKSVLSNQSTISQLGWKPKDSIKDGLNEMYDLHFSAGKEI